MLCVEYLSGDLSALMRMATIFLLRFDLTKMPCACILVVDSWQDANQILNVCNRDFKQGFTRLRHNGVYDLPFLSVGGRYLYSIGGDGRPVKIQP